MTNSIKYTKRRGFTLFEILMAVAIFGIIALTLFSAFSSFVKSSYMVKNNILKSEVIASITNIMLRDFLSLRISLKHEYSIGSSSDSKISILNRDNKDKFRFIGDETTSEGGIFSRIRFSSLAHIPFGNDSIRASKTYEPFESYKKERGVNIRETNPAGVSQIIYYVRPNEEEGFDLCRSDTLNQFDNDEGTDCDPIICKNITTFKITYMDIKGEEQTDWDSESDDFGYATPVSIGIEMEFKIIDSLNTFSTRISMPLFRTPVK